MSVSVYCSRGSRLYLTGPAKRTGSCTKCTQWCYNTNYAWCVTDDQTWGMMEMLFLRSCKPISFVCIPSIMMVPDGSFNRKSTDINEDFPAPVLPTIPTLRSNTVSDMAIVILLGSYLFTSWYVTRKGLEHSRGVICIAKGHIIQQDFPLLKPFGWRLLVWR